jgi:AMP-binding enzyme C-terminal domain
MWLLWEGRYLTQGLHRSMQQKPDGIAKIFGDRVRTFAERTNGRRGGPARYGGGSRRLRGPAGGHVELRAAGPKPGRLRSGGPGRPARRGPHRRPRDRELPRGQIGEIVVRKPSAEVTDAEIRDHVKSLIAGYNAPRTVEFVDVLPATPTGKVIKRELRAKYWAGTERGVN